MSESQEPQNELDLNFHTDMPVGEILRRTRRHYGQSLFQIEQVLRIRASQLEALEENEIHKLPGRVYAIGFVRSYSEYLGLDGDKMVHLFKEQSVGRKQKRPDLAFPVPASESKVPGIAVIGASVFGLLVLVGFISFLVLPDRGALNIEPVPDTLTKSQLNEAPSLVGTTTTPEKTADGATAAPTEGAEAASETPKAGNRIQLEITDASWIEIRNGDGAAILRQVLKPGDIYLVPNEPGLILSTGNAGGIRVKVDGKAVAPIGELAQVKRKVPLDADALAKVPMPAEKKPVAAAPVKTPTSALE